MAQHERLAKVTGLTDTLRDLRVVRRRREDGKNDSNIYVLKACEDCGQNADNAPPHLRLVQGAVN
jgi:hypothetical protein